MGFVLGVTGRRPGYFPWGYDESDPRCLAFLDELGRIVLERVGSGFDTFVSGMALGTDMMFAEVVLGLRRSVPGIRLVAEVPFHGQSSRWPRGSRDRYDSIRAETDEWNVHRASYDPSAFAERNRAIVERSDEILAVWDGVPSGGTYGTYRMAVERGVPVTVLDYTRFGGVPSEEDR